MGERTGRVAQRREALLQMKGHRVVDFCADGRGVEVPLQPIAIRDAHDELVVDVRALRRFGRQRNRVRESGVHEQCAISRSIALASRSPRVEVRQLDT